MGYDKSKQTWFGIDMPASADYGDGGETLSIVEQISKYVYQGVEYLLVAGFFYFESGGNTIINIGLYNLQSNTWSPFSGLEYYDEVLSVAPNATGTLFLAVNFMNASFASCQLGAGAEIIPYGPYIGLTLDLLLLNDMLYISGYLLTEEPSFSYNSLAYSPANTMPQWTFAAPQSLLSPFVFGRAYHLYQSSQ